MLETPRLLPDMNTSPWKKSFSLVTAILFLTQTIAYSAPVSLLTPPLHTKFSSLELSLEIPKPLGQIEEIYQAPESTAAIIHIQDAHGSYEAQKNIRDILRTLVTQQNFKLILVEGAQTALEPNLFHFFKDSSLNLKAADTLMRHGEFSGAEMFLLEESFSKNAKTKTTGQGIEHPELYRHDLILFRKIMAEKDSAGELIIGLRNRLKILENHIFSKELNRFVNEWERHREEGSLIRYAGLLADHAEKHLGLNLRNPVNQGAYPALLRVLTLKEIQTGMDPKKIEQEKKSILEFLKGKIDEKLYAAFAALGAQSHDGHEENPRHLLEKISEQAEPSGFSFKAYPNFSLFAACSIFEHEITSQELFKEIDGLTDQLFEALTKTDSEKNLLLLIRNLAALKKLFSLELSREEYENILKAPYAFKPVSLTEKIRELAVSSRSKVIPWEGSQEATAVRHFEEALEFYRLARERENFFLKKALDEMKKRHETKAVLITGGFHTQGLQEIMKQKGISYALVSPKVGDAKESRVNYLKAMLGTNERPEASVEESQIALYMQLISHAAQQKLSEKSHIEARNRFAALVLWNLALRYKQLAEIRRIAREMPQYRPFLLEQAQANRQGQPDRAADGGLSEPARASGNSLGKTEQLVFVSPHFPPIDLDTLEGEEEVFDSEIHYQPFLMREERLVLPYMGNLRYARQTLEELVLNALRAGETITGTQNPSVRVAMHAYDDAFFRLTVEQPLEDASRLDRLREIHAGFRDGGTAFLESPKQDTGMASSSVQRNNGFFNVAKFMQETPVTLIYSYVPDRKILTTILYFRLKRNAPQAASLGDEEVPLQNAIKAVEETVPGLLAAHGRNLTTEDFIRSLETAVFWRALHQLNMHKGLPNEKDVADSGLPAWAHDLWQLFILDDRLDFAMRVDMGDTSYKFIEQKILELIQKINPQVAILAPIAQRIPQPKKLREKTYTRRSAMGTTGGNEYFETWLGWQTIRTQDDEKLMEVMEYIKRGEEIPADKQRLLPRQVSDRSQVRMFTADKASQNYTATGVEEGETVTPVVRKMKNGDYAIGFEAVSKLTRRPFIVASYVFVRGGQVMTGKPPKSNMEVNDAVSTGNMPTTMSIFVREIIYWLSLGMIPAELAKIHEEDLTKLKERGLIVSGGSGLFAERKIIFWKNPAEKEIALSKVAGVEDPILKIHKDQNGTWIASLWARARKVKQGEDLPDKITRPEIPLNDLILYAPDEKGFRIKEKEFPNKPVGFEHVEGEIPDVSRTFRNALQARWYVYWLANGGDQIPDEEDITVKHGRDEYLYRFADAVQQPLLGQDFTKGKTVRSWVTFSSDKNIRGVHYQNIQDGQVKAEKYFILYKGNQFQLPEEVSADQVEHVAAAPSFAGPAAASKEEGFVPFHASLIKEQRFQIIKERRKIQQKILALDAELKETLAGTTGERINRLEQIQSEMESLLLLASDLRDIQTTGDFSGKEDLKQTLGFLWNVSYVNQKIAGDTATRERFTQTLDRVFKNESTAGDWDFLNSAAAGVQQVETGDEFSGVALPVDRREPYPRLFPGGPDGPGMALGNYSKDNIVVTARSEAKGPEGKIHLRVRIYDPARLDTPLNSYYFDHELNRFVDSKEEWKRWLAGISNLGVPGDMIAAALTEGGQVNIFNYFVRGTAGVNVTGDQETQPVTLDETAAAGATAIEAERSAAGKGPAAGEQKIFGTINMGSALFDEKVHEGFFPFGTSGVGPILFFRAEERNGQKIVTAYGSSNLTEHNEIGSYPWIADDPEILAAKSTGLIGFGRGAEGPLKELAGYDYVPSRNESLRAWVNGEESPLREFVDPDSIKQRGVPMPAPSADVANPSKLRITEGTLGEAVTWRNTVESVFFGELALDLYYRNNAFPAQRGFYSAEAPLGINSFLEAIRRFHRVAHLTATTPQPAEPLLMHRPGSWKMGEGRFELLDGVRGKTGKKVGTNVFNNAFKDIEDMGLSTDHAWIEYGYITEDGRTLPVMYFISMDKEHKKATLAVRVVEIADNYFRYDKYKGGQDVSNIVIPRAIERGYFRPVSAVVYPELLENRLRLIEREIKIAKRPKDGWEGLQVFAQTSLLDQLLEARRLNPQGENWAEIYFYLASQSFREGLARMAAEVHQLYTQTGGAASADFLRNPKVLAFLSAFENNPDIKRYSHEEPWRLQPLRYLSEQIEQLNVSGPAGHSAEDLARITDQIAAGLIAMAQELPAVAFEKVPPVNIKLRERPRKGERGQMMASHDAIGEAEVTGLEAEGYVLPPVASPLMPPPQPVTPKPIRVPTVSKPKPAPAPPAEKTETPAETTSLPKPPATPPPTKVVETAPVAAVAPATLGEHPILTLWPKELTDADRVLFGELPATKSRFKRVEKLADAVPAAYRTALEKSQGGTLTYPEPDVVTLEENFFGLYEAIDLPANQRAALTQSFQALKASQRAGRLAGTSPLPAFNVGREWARFRHGSGKKDYAERARRRQALIWRPATYNWNKAREPFLKDAKNQEEEEDFLSARVATDELEKAVKEIQARHPEMEYFWVEMAPAFGTGVKQHPALYIAGVDWKRKQASAVLRLIEPRRDVFEKSASPVNLDISNQIFGFLAEHGYRLPQEEIPLEERVRGRLELVQKLHESEKLVDDIDLLVTEEHKPLTDLQVSELLTRYFETDFITHLIESRKAAGDRTGTSILDFPFLLSSVRLKPLYEAAKAVAGAADLSKESAALFLNQVTQRDEFSAIFGYQKSMRHEVANILESRLEVESEATEAIRWTKVLAQKILGLSQSPYPVSYKITGKMPRPVTRKPKEEAPPEPEAEPAEPETPTPAEPAAEATAIEADPFAFAQGRQKARQSDAGKSPAAAETTPAVGEPTHETAPAVTPTVPQPIEQPAEAQPEQPAGELSRFEREILEARENPDHGWELVSQYMDEIETLRGQEAAGQTNPDWNTELLTPHLTDLLGAFDTAGYRATLTLPELRELQMIYSITAYYGALFFKQAGDDIAARQEWDSAVNHAQEALKIFDREPESEDKNHPRGQEIVDWILALDAENSFLAERQKQQQSGHLRELRQQYAAYNYGMRFDYQDDIAALEAQILALAPNDSGVRKARDYRKIYYTIAELERDLPELDMRGFRERARDIRDRIRSFRDYRDTEAWITLTAALIEADIHKLAADVKNFRLIRIDVSGVVHIDTLTQALHTAYFERVQAIQDFIAQQLPDSASSAKGELRMTLLETRHAYDAAVKELPDEIRKRQAEMERTRQRRTPPPPSTPAPGKPAKIVERQPDRTSRTDETDRPAGKKKDKKKDRQPQAAPQPVVISEKLDAELARRAQTALGTVQQKIERYDEEARRRKMPEPLHVLRDMEHLLLHILAAESAPAQAAYQRFANTMVHDFMTKRNKPTTAIMDETYNIARSVLGAPNISAESLGSESQARDYSLKNGRAAPQAMIEIARDVTFKLYSLPGANVAVVNYYKNALGLADERLAPPVNEAVQALQTGQMTVRNLLDFVHGKPAENRKPLIVFVNEFFEENGGDLSKDEIASMAHTIATNMNQGDLFIGIVRGEIDRQLMGELYHETKGRFRAKALPHELLTETTLVPLSKSVPAAPASISTLEHAGDAGLEIEELLRIRVNEKILRQSGMDWSTAIAMLRQIVDDPENLPKLQFRFDKDGYWEMGSGFLTLLETVYNRMKTANRLNQAA